MRRADLIAFERFVAETYRREASNRRSKNPELAAQLDAWGEASERRIEALRCGPLFIAEEA
jgi:hypothetical protein